MFTFWIVTPCAAACWSVLASHCTKAGSSFGPVVVPLPPAPVSSTASGFPSALARAIVSASDQPPPVPVGSYWFASGYSHQCSRLVSLSAQLVASLAWPVSLPLAL